MYQEVNILSYYFTPGSQNRCFPRQIEIDGQQLSFLENGLRCLVMKGQQLTQIFNMSDGKSLYRLSYDPENRSWKLLSSRAL